ncbi:hypothetical protein SUGI_0320760 [Cryptomeria japonica]|uniref:LOB domain-containing protein 1 n=1 Tax=Cryptomeria japonica TaxID=3369 RepID=UPI002408C545|nr:LOB domain-containing protein 1 [Cryptomeria japonica]GLJ18155.1 hypothetical protein SUGI_0320760 [Cryptomeria japonica]
MSAYPCAACKINRKRCGDKCVLAPYFPSHNPHRFLTVRSVFGAGNLCRIIQNVPDEKREDAVNSIVYEAGARVSDPVYGCAGRVFELQKKLVDLESELAMAQEELRNVRANLVSVVGKPPFLFETQNIVTQRNDENCEELILSEDVDDPFGLWEPL